MIQMFLPVLGEHTAGAAAVIGLSNKGRGVVGMSEVGQGVIGIIHVSVRSILKLLAWLYCSAFFLLRMEMGKTLLESLP